MTEQELAERQRREFRGQATDPNMPSHFNTQYQPRGDGCTPQPVMRSPSARELIETELCELDRWSHCLRSLLPVAAAMEAGTGPDRAIARLLSDGRTRR